MSERPAVEVRELRRVGETLRMGRTRRIRRMNFLHIPSLPCCDNASGKA